MSDLGWLFVAFFAVWIGIGAYLLSIATRQRKLEKRLEELSARTHAREPERPQATADSR